jgi:beta-lactam-binding protein with PASTA domain
MATRRELPPDFAAALDRYPAARVSFAAMPLQRQNEWLAWIDRGRSRRGRAGRIDEAIRRLSPPATEEVEIVEPVGPPPQRAWWLWLLALLVLVVAGLLLGYFLTRGPGKTIVPDVIGLEASDAAARLHAAHLKDSPTTGASTKPPGIVFAERPGAGTQLDKNQTVTISISSGRASTPVPNVTGLPEAQAMTQLTARGFKAQVQRRAGTRPRGIVFAQQPAAGVTAVKGTTVILSVSSGVQRVTVPAVVGQTQGAAVTQLTTLGLKPQLMNVPSTQPAGQVVAQNPAPGAKVDKGSTVALNVSSGSGGGTTTTTTALVPVPDVVGQDQASASSAIRQAGLKPLVLFRTTTDQTQDGNVVEEQPSAGASVPSGSSVTIFVGRFSG